MSDLGIAFSLRWQGGLYENSVGWTNKYTALTYNQKVKEPCKILHELTKNLGMDPFRM